MSFPNCTVSLQHPLTQLEPEPLTGEVAQADSCSEIALAEPADGPEVRLAKVAALRSAISGGTYRVPSGDVAEKIMLLLLTGQAANLQVGEQSGSI